MKEKLIVITGPTASGKTTLSVELALKFNGEIINADASQVYKYLDIGTAKITKDEMKGIIHHLIDFLDPHDNFSIKDYQELARKTILDIIARGKVPFLVGGSGLYINSVITNYQLDGPPRDINFEQQFENLSNDELYELLKHKDEKIANTVHPNNRRRVLRKLQLLELNYPIPMDNDEYLYDVLLINLVWNRNKLYQRINERTIQMFNNGWLAEARWLVKNGYDLTKVNGIGYLEILKYLNNEISFDDLIQSIQQKIRRYAKRQITWIKNQFDTFDIKVDEENFQNTINEASKLIQDFLNNKN